MRVNVRGQSDHQGGAIMPGLRIFLHSAVVVASLGFATGVMAQAALELKFADPAWDGVTIPEGQHCALQGGTGATPALDVSGLPEGTATVNVAFNDETYQPMNDGGHGIIAFTVTPADGKATLPSVPGGTAELPEGASVATASRGTGEYASPGYLPPCSGAAGNTYSATVTALDSAGAELATGKIEMGKY
jgi:phosphatidylethanolamine-binding protein (PEBP) family uncharacterized protein